MPIHALLLQCLLQLGVHDNAWFLGLLHGLASALLHVTLSVSASNADYVKPRCQCHGAPHPNPRAPSRQAPAMTRVITLAI